MSDREFEEFCRAHGACNVDIDKEIEVSFALDLLSVYFREHPAGVIERLGDVRDQIEKIIEIAI